MPSLRDGARSLRLRANYLLLVDKQVYTDLDSILGNEDGEFKLGGTGVSQTLKNAYTSGLIIYGDLLCDDGTWQRAEIDLNEAIFEGGLFPDLVSCIDTLLGNDNGSFVMGSDVSKSARSLKIIGDTLHGELRNNDGEWQPARIDLWKRHHRFPQIKNVLGYHGPTDHVDITSNKFLPPYILLTTSSLALVGDYKQENDWQSFEIALESMIARNVKAEHGKLVIQQHDGQFFFFEPKLIGTKLSSTLMGMGSWNMHHSTIDLNCVLSVGQEGIQLQVPRQDLNPPDDSRTDEPPFCTACAHLFRGGTFLKQADWVVLNPGTDCSFCKLIHDAREQYFPSGLLQSVHVRTVYSQDRYGVDEIEVQFRKGAQSRTSLLCSISDHWDDTLHFRTLPRKQTPINIFQPSIKSDIALGWVDNCLRSHQSCSKARRGQLPHRVICVKDDNVRLTQGNHVRPYAALSYCWGGVSAAHYMLTNENINRYMTSIALHTLPQTLRDAIMFTRAMGLSYIWIDVLCILQDDSADWEIESAKMKDYYANCLVCIAATASESSSAGCNVDPLPPVLTATGFGEDSLPYAIALLPSELNANHFGAPGLPLLTRGWAYQERRLAPRILHFCKYELMFECLQGMSCECGGAPRLDTIWTKSFRPIVHTVDDAQYRDSPRSVIDHSIMVWQADVRQYSQRLLTYEKDRLPALSGLAKLDRVVSWSDKTWDRGQYLAGLWTNHMPFDLMWRVGETWPVKATPAERPKSYQAPSWSWASVTAPVEFWLTPCGWVIGPEDLCWQSEQSPEEFRSLINIVNGSTKTGLDPTGRVDDGFLEIQGRLGPMQWHRDGEGVFSIDGFDGLFFPDVQLKLGKDLHLLPVYAPIDYGRHNGEPCAGVFYLVLEMVDTDQYSRVGSAVGRCAQTQDRSALWDHFPAGRAAEVTTIRLI